MAAALESITIPVEGATTDYLIRIAPGHYTSDATLVMKDRVSLEGSGQGVTVLDCTCSAIPALLADDVTGEVRHLTVAAVGDQTNAITTEDITDASFSLRHVTATAVGTNDWGTSAVQNTRSSVRMTDVTARVDALTGVETYVSAVNNSQSSPTMTRVVATAVTQGAGGTTIAVNNDQGSPVLDGVTATASASNGTSSTVFGVRNTGAVVSLTDTVARAVDADTAAGISNYQAEVTIAGGSAHGTGLLTGMGVQIYGSTVQLVGVAASGSGTAGYGLRTYSNSTVTVRDSSLTGSTYGIYNEQSDTRLAGSMLGGGLTGGATCVTSYDTGFNLLGIGCQPLP